MRRFSGLCALALLCSLAVSAADITGIWVGQVPGRNEEMTDVAFQFKQDGAALTGKMFGDEFDLKIGDAQLSGEEISFSVTTTNYYSMTQMKFVYRGTVKDGAMELTREREGAPPGGNPQRRDRKQSLTLKRLI